MTIRYCMVLFTVFLSCGYYPPITPVRLNNPQIANLSLTPVSFSTWREAVRIAWTPPSTDSIGIRSYTLLRKTGSDSLFDVFTSSRGIPDSITTFHDDASLIGFPLDSAFFLVEYKIFAIDTLGRPGDTSAACSLYIARQPELKTINKPSWCINWESSRIQASVSSWITVWTHGRSRRYTSLKSIQFSNENVPAAFSACVPDSVKPVSGDSLAFAIYLEAGNAMRQSLKVGTLYVP